MLIKKVVFLLIMFSLSVTACAEASVGNDLDGSSWELTSLNGNVPVSGGEPTLNFEDGLVRGNASCNQFGGEVQIKGNMLVFAEGMDMTAMACLDESIMDQEQVFMRMLSGEMQFEITDGQLILINQQGEVLVFERIDSGN